jgi:signal transduction histidine kinase
VLNAIDACHWGDSVKLNAEINGSGVIRINVVGPAASIAPEVVEHIFEPLFTTKPGGNGLGLPIARNIARARMAATSCWESTSRVGVCFSIEIPAPSS